MDHFSILVGLFVTTLILQIGDHDDQPDIDFIYPSIEWQFRKNILFVSGLIVSVAGVSAVFSSPPKLGETR